MTYRYLTPALSEVTEAAEYYETQVFGLGADFLDELDAAIQRILDFPEAWGVISEDGDDRYRHCSLHRFPYTVIYTEESAEEILIVSVFHQHREPLSWRRNL